ncbi:hypothetical protein J2753_000408 [Halolamina salifodinae]|uniref:Uncharacterized protein n=1 Tax=Halolamina salifodinae TaxID=1202767 RepID=A0A8T4GX91_9EURY|nr:hypothetical protein [Halolamina salifodinae]
MEFLRELPLVSDLLDLGFIAAAAFVVFLALALFV